MEMTTASCGILVVMRFTEEINDSLLYTQFFSLLIGIAVFGYILDFVLASRLFDIGMRVVMYCIFFG